MTATTAARPGDTVPNQGLIEELIDARLADSTGADAQTQLGVKSLVTLVAGTKVVADTNITANSVIRIEGVKTVGGTVGAHFVAAKTPGTGFTITSTSNTDTSTLQVLIDYDG